MKDEVCPICGGRIDTLYLHLSYYSEDYFRRPRLIEIETCYDPRCEKNRKDIKATIAAEDKRHEIGKRRALMTLSETAYFLRIARAKIYDLIQDGILKAVKVGARWRVETDSVEKISCKIPDDFWK